MKKSAKPQAQNCSHVTITTTQHSNAQHNTATPQVFFKRLLVQVVEVLALVPVCIYIIIVVEVIIL
jgi:lipopolysaccharide/colanic/teichoic acid biosynthesis glycosyltransferase